MMRKKENSDEGEDLGEYIVRTPLSDLIKLKAMRYNYRYLTNIQAIGGEIYRSGDVEKIARFEKEISKFTERLESLLEEEGPVDFEKYLKFKHRLEKEKRPFDLWDYVNCRFSGMSHKEIYHDEEITERFEVSKGKINGFGMVYSKYCKD